MIVIGDVHGCYKTLMALVNKLPHNNLCFVGDVIDRGNNSKECVEFVMQHKCVLGNHEDFVRCIDSTTNVCERALIEDSWISNGGAKTIKSFHDEPHILYDWIVTLPITISYRNKIGKDFIISHSAFNMKEKNKTKQVDSVLWGRDYHKNNMLNDIGHTPYKKIKFFLPWGVCIDTGCVFGNILTAFDLETSEIYTQENIEDET